MVFELNLCELGHKTYDLFSKEMQKSRHKIDASVMVTDY